MTKKNNEREAQKERRNRERKKVERWKVQEDRKKVNVHMYCTFRTEQCSTELKVYVQGSDKNK